MMNRIFGDQVADTREFSDQRAGVGAGSAGDWGWGREIDQVRDTQKICYVSPLFIAFQGVSRDPY